MYYHFLHITLNSLETFPSFVLIEDTAEKSCDLDISGKTELFAADNLYSCCLPVSKV